MVVFYDSWKVAWLAVAGSFVEDVGIGDGIVGGCECRMSKGETPVYRSQFRFRHFPVGHDEDAADG